MERRSFFAGAIASLVAVVCPKKMGMKPSPQGPVALHYCDLEGNWQSFTLAERMKWYQDQLQYGAMTVNQVREAEGLSPIKES